MTMDVRAGVSDVLKTIPDDKLVAAQYEMFCSSALLGSDKQKLVKFDLLQVCFPTARKHLNDKVSLESDKDKKRNAGGYRGKLKALSFEVRKRLHGESLTEVLHPPTIALVCINIMRGILKILSKVEPPYHPSNREDNIVGPVTVVNKSMNMVNSDLSEVGVISPGNKYLTSKVLADLQVRVYINVPLQYHKERSKKLEELKASIETQEICDMEFCLLEMILVEDTSPMQFSEVEMGDAAGSECDFAEPEDSILCIVFTT
jgi:hypothetical protein